MYALHVNAPTHPTRSPARARSDPRLPSAGSSQSSPTSPPDSRWLDPSPFRAHVIHLMATSGLTARELAALARVSARLVGRLVGGRDGRPMRRIDPLSAGRLLAVSGLDADLARSRQVPAEHTRALLLTLYSRGRSVASLARLTGLSAGEIGLLAAGRTALCFQIVEIRLLAALADSDARMAARAPVVPPERTDIWLADAA